MMKKIIYLSFIYLSLILSSCGDKFLDQENLYQSTESNYYSSPQDINEALTAAYSCLAMTEANGSQDDILIAETMSDNVFTGGGAEDYYVQSYDEFEMKVEDMTDVLWQRTYTGIFRANMVIKYFDQAVYTNEIERKQALGEAHFLRAYFYWRLVKFYGEVPLITDPSTADPNPAKAPANEVYALIASDLKIAIENMESTAFQSIPVERLGHATKWAAEALMARVFLFYTGYYNQTALPLTEDGGNVSKSEVISWLEDCINNSGHRLTNDFRNIWPYSYATADYPYASDNNLSWVGESGNNVETVFAIKYSTFGNWGDEVAYTNHLTLFWGVRENADYHVFGTGWGCGTVNPQLWDVFEEGDIRREGSILDVTNPDEGDLGSYEWGADGAQQETGLWNKKYTPITVNDGGTWNGMYNVIYGTSNDFMMWNMQDEILIRFADVLLMAAELGSANAQKYFDRVRNRSIPGSPKAATLENIKHERRVEFAFEGLRYHDLLRWHDEVAAFAKATNIPVKNNGVDATYTMKYRPETKGFLPIPPSQVRISGGVLLQNDGWN